MHLAEKCLHLKGYTNNKLHEQAINEVEVKPIQNKMNMLPNHMNMSRHIWCGINQWMIALLVPLKSTQETTLK